jgi:hypothetical protein
MLVSQSGMSWLAEGERAGLVTVGVDTELPAVELPAVELPAVELPAVELPAVELPAVELPAADGLGVGGCEAIPEDPGPVSGVRLSEGL